MKITISQGRYITPDSPGGIVDECGFDKNDVSEKIIENVLKKKISSEKYVSEKLFFPKNTFRTKNFFQNIFDYFSGTSFLSNPHSSTMPPGLSGVM